MGTPGLHLVGQQVQSQNLSPRMQRAVKMLQMSSLDYAHELHEALARNPFLEDEADNAPALPPTLEALASPALASEVAAKKNDLPSQEVADDIGTLTKADESMADLMDWPDASPARGEGGTLTAIDMASSTGGLADHLHRQIGLRKLTQRQWALAHALVDLLENDG